MAATPGGNSPQSIAAETLRSFLAGSTTASDAAKRFNSVVAQVKDPEDGLYEIFTRVNEAAQERLDVQEKLIELIKAVKSLPDLTVGGEPVNIRGQYVVWRDLPILGEDLRSRWECK